MPGDSERARSHQKEGKKCAQPYYLRLFIRIEDPGNQEKKNAHAHPHPAKTQNRSQLSLSARYLIYYLAQAGVSAHPARYTRRRAAAASIARAVEVGAVPAAVLHLPVQRREGCSPRDRRPPLRLVHCPPANAEVAVAAVVAAVVAAAAAAADLDLD